MEEASGQHRARGTQQPRFSLWETGTWWTVPRTALKRLYAVISRLPNKAARSAAGPVGWIFRTGLKASIDSVLRDARLMHQVQRCLEKPEPHVLALQQEARGPGEPSISDGKAVRGGDEQGYERVPAQQRGCYPVECEV